TITDPTHPIVQGVTTLTAFFRHTVTLATGAVSVAAWQDGPSAVAYKVNNGRTGVGINAYLGENPRNWSGQFGRVIANAGRFIRGGGGCITPTATATPTACLNTLNGHLTYQGMPQPNAGNVQAITLQLQPTGGGTLSTYSTSTDINANFTLNLGPLAPGTYNWWLKSPRYLATTGTLTIPAGCAPFSQEFGTQRAGDIDNTNCVDISDFSILRLSFGKACGDPGYNPNAEYTGDCIVDISDFSLLRSNFGQCGPAELTRPGGAKP
ncbi:MAG: hypothetical protein ABIO92_00270, partial [Chloroflexia bacterium]